jgi:oligoribonuclease NrnB/cAMP/cGMP phosphodiesterase (DHH superfamily)
MEKNAIALKQLLDTGVDVFYVDHHRSGAIPNSNKLHAIIDTDANTCTSLLVNTYLNGQYVYWAIAAAYGDNMLTSADELANEVGLSDSEKAQLKALGIYINYNGYGRSVDDLHFSPEQLFLQLVKYENPLTLINEENSVFYQLENAYNQDMSKAVNAEILADSESCKALKLPDEAWARRVSGVFGNELANQSPDKAHVVLTVNNDKTYTVSLRAPLNNKQGAGDICAEFPTGGGRAAAAGVNKLPAEMINAFIKAVAQYYA